MMGAIRMHPWRVLALTVAALVLVVGLSATLRLDIPPPSGEFAVGRAGMAWVDSKRPELHTPNPEDQREVVATIWYPAERTGGRPAPYVADLDDIDRGLVASGQL